MKMAPWPKPAGSSPFAGPAAFFFINRDSITIIY
jgi:hypothetical protein